MHQAHDLYEEQTPQGFWKLNCRTFRGMNFIQETGLEAGYALISKTEVEHKLLVEKARSQGLLVI